MKKYIAIVLAFALMLTLSACIKSRAAKSAEELIAALGEITIDSLEQLEAAEEAYAALSEDDKRDVENYADLISARTAYDKIYKQAQEDAFLARISGEWIGVNDGDIYTLEAGGTGNHDGVACQYTFRSEENTVTIMEGAGSAEGMTFTLSNDAGVDKLVPEGKDVYYVRPGDYEAISAVIREETVALLTSYEWWTALTTTNFISFTESGDGWFLMPGVTFGMQWEFVDNNTVKIHIDYGGGQSVVLDVVNDNGSLQLVNGKTGVVTYIPEQ